MAIDMIGSLSMFFGDRNVNGCINVNSGYSPYQNSFFGGGCGFSPFGGFGGFGGGFGGFGGFTPFGGCGGFGNSMMYGNPFQMGGGCRPGFYGYRGGGYRECRDDGSNILELALAGVCGYALGKNSKDNQEKQAESTDKK